MPLSFGSRIPQKVLLRPVFGKCKISMASMKILLWYVHNKQLLQGRGNILVILDFVD